jgi:hypothetical protein
LLYQCGRKNKNLGNKKYDVNFDAGFFIALFFNYQEKPLSLGEHVLWLFTFFYH